MIEETNDKALFRSTRLPASSSATVPQALRWAMGEGEYITGGVGGGKSTLGSIVFSDGSIAGAGGEIVGGPEIADTPQVPTPRIVGVASQEVYQTLEGFSKADVFIAVDGMEGVEYEVVVTKA